MFSRGVDRDQWYGMSQSLYIVLLNLVSSEVNLSSLSGNKNDIIVLWETNEIAGSRYAEKISRKFTFPKSWCECVILNKKEFIQIRAGIQQNRNRGKIVFVFILKEFNSDVAAEL